MRNAPPNWRERIASWWGAQFVQPLHEIDADMRRNLAQSSAFFDKRTAWVMLTATVALALQWYLSRSTDLIALARLLPTRVGSNAVEWLSDSGRTRFGELAWWSGSTLVAYILIPFLVVKLVLRERLVDYGLGIKKAVSGWPIYAAMAVFMVPVVTAAASTEAFIQKYPFFRLTRGEAIPREFWWWEVLYAMQFIGLEFFFRGFMVHGLKHRFGVASVLVMTTPYCMIHFGKPMAETFAAILAGLALGIMSLKTGTVWLGAALHIMVAWTMDALALYRGGFLG
jgi:membrane protease YdiL (CAAX protease family)